MAIITRHGKYLRNIRRNCDSRRERLGLDNRRIRAVDAIKLDEQKQGGEADEKYFQRLFEHRIASVRTTRHSGCGFTSQ